MDIEIDINRIILAEIYRKDKSIHNHLFCLTEAVSEEDIIRYIFGDNDNVLAINVITDYYNSDEFKAIKKQVLKLLMKYYQFKQQNDNIIIQLQWNQFEEYIPHIINYVTQVVLRKSGSLTVTEKR